MTEMLIYPRYEQFQVTDGEFLTADGELLLVGQSDYQEYESFCVENSEFLLVDGKVLKVRVFPVKYLMSFISERGFEYRIEVREKNYGGVPKLKKLGAMPVMNIDQGEGSILWQWQGRYTGQTAAGVRQSGTCAESRNCRRSLQKGRGDDHDRAYQDLHRSGCGNFRQCGRQL